MANNGDTQAGRDAVSLSDPLFFFDSGCPAAEQEAEYGPQPRQEGSGGATENIIWPFFFRVIRLAAELRHRKTVTEYKGLSDDFACESTIKRDSTQSDGRMSPLRQYLGSIALSPGPAPISAASRRILALVSAMKLVRLKLL